MSTIQESQSPGLLDYTVRALGSPQLVALVALAAALTLGAGLILWSIKPGMITLFERVDRQEVSQILDVLRSENVVYEIQPKTGLIMVAQDQVEKIRMKLAAEGIPASSSTGMEMLQQEQSLGTSQFMESNRYQHALETELSRTISGMRNIDSARVHLAIPKQSVFIRNRAKSSASVMVKLFPGRTLEKGQVLSIVNLVASSIPYLESSQVTVVDQWGQLFSSQDDGSGSGETSKQFEHTRQLESLYAKRIEALLAPLVGEGNVRATVTADIDFSTNEQTQELFEGDAAQIRSEQNQDQTASGLSAAVGIPGALSNQPPVAGTTDPQPVGSKQQGNAGDPVNSTRNSTRNYELDKTITHQRKAPGTIRQVSAAVIVDDRKSVNEAGEVVRTPLTTDEIAKFTTLVREAIGFREIRGDSVVVLNQSFQPPEEMLPIEPLPIWEQPWFWGAGKQLLAGLGVLLIIIMVVRPAMRTLKSPNQQLVDKSGKDRGREIHVEVGDDQTGDDEQAGRESLEAPKQVYGDILNMARAMADEDPRRVAKVVKDWVGSAND